MKQIALLWLTLIAAIVSGCGGPTEPTPTPVPPTPTPSPQDWLDGAVRGWNETESFRFVLQLQERTISLDEGGLLSFSEAEGTVVAPDSLQAEALVRTPLGATEIAYISIGPDQWLTNPLSGQWEQAPPEMATDVTALFDRQAGLGSLLAEMEALQRMPDATFEEVPMVHLRGTLPGAVLSDFASDLPETVTVDLWVGAGEPRIHRVVLTEPAVSGLTPTWTFLFSEFDAAPAIEPPL